MTFRRAAIVAALAAAAACARRSPESVSLPDSSAVEFAPKPAIEAVHAANPHEHEGAPLCQRCHVNGERDLSVDAVALCEQCHERGRMKHPVGVVQATRPADLPFYEDGRIACHTCHDPHDLKKHGGGLRLRYVELCLRCHERHGARAASAPSN